MKRGRKSVICSLLVLSIVLVSVLSYCTNKKSKVVKADNGRIEFEYSSSALDENTVRLNNKAVFDEKYFEKDSLEYNHDLAKLSLVMAMASSSTAESKDYWGTVFNNVVDTTVEEIDPATARNAYIVDVYKQLGFTDDIYEKYEVSLNDTTDTVGYSIAKKKINVNGKNYNLVLANARSVSYGAEWASNFTMKNEYGNSGFRQCGEQFYQGIKEYIEENNLGENTKVWLPGFSRGAAAANVAAALLTKDAEAGKYLFSKEDIYGYMFATPSSSIDDEYNSEMYNNIFNIINEADFVPTTAPACWNFRRYGRTITIPQLLVSKKELKKIQEGKYVNVDEKTVNAIKSISYDYNVMRHENAVNDNEYVPVDKLYIGFTVNKELTELGDILFRTVTEDVDEYAEKYQGVAKEIVPFLINHVRKYDSSKDKWVNYGNLGEYLCDKYGTEVFNEAARAGVFSQTDYDSKLEAISNMLNKGIINEDKASLLEYVLDTYYGVRIIAFKYGINSEIIKELTTNMVSELWTMLKKFNLNDPLCCRYVHYAEFYMAWMENYNPYTKEFIK